MAIPLVNIEINSYRDSPYGIWDRNMKYCSREIVITFAVLSFSAAALAQSPKSGVGPTDPGEIRQIFIYGDDPCPQGFGDEIVICARLPNNDRYRIPANLRAEVDSPVRQAWARRAKAIEHVGASGINSCSPAGSGGFSGCFKKISNIAREERKMRSKIR